MSPKVFPSKVDLWLALVFAAAALACVGAAVTMAVSPMRGGALVATLTLIVGLGLPGWLLLTTCYTFEGDALYVRSGPFRWTIRCADITSVHPTRNPLSSPALSLDRLRIEYGEARALMVSPRDQEGFLRELEARRRA